MHPTREALELFKDGMIALSAIEEAGVRIDVPYLTRTIDKAEKDLAVMREALRSDREVYPLLRKRFGDRLNLDSRPQLAEIVFNVLNYPCKERTATGKPKADETAFEDVNLPYVRSFIGIQKLDKLLGTYLYGIRNELDPFGYAHCNYNLHLAISYRSSCDNFNFQNLPVRDPERAETVRRCFIPRDDHRIVEIDFTGIEVRVAACYHKDPNMISYIKDPTKDMHRDMAAQLYCIDQASAKLKPNRHAAKNSFVFAQFYGDYYIHCAAGLWVRLDRENLVTADGTPIRKILERKGIVELGDQDPSERPRPGTFELHVKEVEEDFWGRRFREYGRWRKEWWQKYQERGYFDSLTGFRYQGVMARNDVINYAVQGSAFHCCLWSVIKLQKFIERRGLRTRIVGQIHDSIILDVHESEVELIVRTARKIMTENLPKVWDWIIVPLDVEVEAAPPGASWLEKKPFSLEN